MSYWAAEYKFMLTVEHNMYEYNNNNKTKENKNTINNFLNASCFADCFKET